MLNKFKQNAENIEKINLGNMIGELELSVKKEFDTSITTQNLEFESVADLGVEETFVNIANGQSITKADSTQLEIGFLVEKAMEKSKGQNLNISGGFNIPNMSKLADTAGSAAASAIGAMGGDSNNANLVGLAMKSYIQYQTGDFTGAAKTIAESSGVESPGNLQKASDISAMTGNSGISSTFDDLKTAKDAGFDIPGMNMLEGTGMLNSMTPEAVGDQMVGLIKEPPGLNNLVSDLKIKYGIV